MTQLPSKDAEVIVRIKDALANRGVAVDYKTIATFLSDEQGMSLAKPFFEPTFTPDDVDRIASSLTKPMNKPAPSKPAPRSPEDYAQDYFGERPRPSTKAAPPPSSRYPQEPEDFDDDPRFAGAPPFEDDDARAPREEKGKYVNPPSSIDVYSKDDLGRICLTVFRQPAAKDRENVGERIYCKFTPHRNGRFDRHSAGFFAVSEEEMLYFVKRLVELQQEPITFPFHGKDRKKSLRIDTTSSGRIRLVYRDGDYRRSVTLEDWHRFKVVAIALVALSKEIGCSPNEALELIKAVNPPYPEKFTDPYGKARAESPPEPDDEDPDWSRGRGR